MIEAVLVFAFISALFELGALSYLEPRTRLRWLNRPGTLTFVVTLANLLVHWGTITGSMTAATAGLASMATTSFARYYWGWIAVVDGRVRYYHGIVRFTREQLM